MGVEILLGELAVGGVPQTKSKNRHSDTEHTFEKQVYEQNMFPKYDGIFMSEMKYSTYE